MHFVIVSTVSGKHSMIVYPGLVVFCCKVLVKERASSPQKYIASICLYGKTLFGEIFKLPICRW